LEQIKRTRKIKRKIRTGFAWALALRTLCVVGARAAFRLS